MRPFRFGLATSRVSSAGEFFETVRRADQSGYDVLLVPDHLGILSPEAAMVAAAERSDRLRVGSFVFNNDFRHPVLLAQQAASVDLLTSGRLELGLGAGWNIPEYEASGIEYDPPDVRIARMEEAVVILRRLFAGETVSFSGDHYTITDHVLTPPPPQGASLPVMIGGNGDRLLAVAARHADVVGLTGYTMRRGQPVMSGFSAAGIAERVAVVRDAAGDRAEALEFNALIQRVVITTDRRSAALELVDQWDSPYVVLDAALDSPFALFGTVAEIGEQLRRYRRDLGISYYAIVSRAGKPFDAVVESLAGE